MKFHEAILLTLMGLVYLAISPFDACAQVYEHFSQSSFAQSPVEFTQNELAAFAEAPNQFADSGVYEGGTLLAFLGNDGSKQPQDFGANANFGAGASLSYSAPLLPDFGVGFQIGTRATFSGNGVQVFELLGEPKDRFQSFTTVGVFQRFDNGISMGAAYDFLTQESFDNFTLGQWRIKATADISPIDELGITFNLSGRPDTGFFNSTLVELEPIEQLRVHLKRRWQSGVMTSFWIGVADAHSEENVLGGALPRKTNQILFGSEIHAPLNQWLALYGETNVVLPADTGAIDAYLGLEFSPQGAIRSRSKRNRFRALLPVASNPSFTVDLNRR